MQEDLDDAVASVTQNFAASTSAPQAAAEGLEVNAEDQPSAFDDKVQGDPLTSSDTVGSPVAGDLQLLPEAFTLIQLVSNKLFSRHCYMYTFF